MPQGPARFADRNSKVSDRQSSPTACRLCNLRPNRSYVAQRLVDPDSGKQPWSHTMPLVPMRILLDHAAANSYGLAAFNVNNMEQIQAIMEAAAETESPVIV